MGLSGLRILLVDDDPAVRETMRLCLEEAGVSVAEACDGREAIRRLHDDPSVRVMVTDIVMPEMEGLTLIQSAHKEFPGLKIVAISGGGLFEPDTYLESARYLGASVVLPKPFDMSELVDALSTLAPPA